MGDVVEGRFGAPEDPEAGMLRRARSMLGSDEDPSAVDVRAVMDELTELGFLVTVIGSGSRLTHRGWQFLSVLCSLVALDADDLASVSAGFPEVQWGDVTSWMRLRGNLEWMLQQAVQPPPGE